LSDYGVKIIELLKSKRFLIITTMDKDYYSQKTTSIAIIAIVAALGVLGVVIVLAVVTIPVQEAEAGCERGNAGSHALNQSKGRCFDRGTF
jgi:hypothetical protein